MAKKKESTATDNISIDKVTPDTQASAKGGTEATEKITAKRGRSKKGAEESPDVTNLRETETAATSPAAPAGKMPAKRGSRKKTDVPVEESGVSIPVAAIDDVTQQAGAKPKGRSKTTKLSAPPTQENNLQNITAEQPQEDKAIYHNVSRFTEFDVYLFREGKHFTLYDQLGSHPMEHAGKQGVYFAVWAPNAEQVSVMGDFNGWSRDSHPMQARSDGSGIWEGFILDVRVGMLYKYHIKSRYNLYHVEKSDPFAFCREVPPQTASAVAELNYNWQDNSWLQRRKELTGQPQPYSVYELHVGSWRRKPEDNNRPLTYRELAEELPQYVKDMGFTHVEFMPLMYHPFNGSWGYQITGYFAPASIYGSPQDLMHLIDALHQQGVGVIMDWVPSHFPSDEHGLAYFDGTHLYEHADPRKGYHPDWNSYIFNYGRNEVRSFLISNALFWLDKYHIDSLRVDAVASMLYLDYSRKHGEWIPNEHGGRENLEAISFIKDFNQAVHQRFPDVQTVAEESTAWPAVTGAVEYGGLGFNMKWMMGWMHDTLDYFSKDSLYRRYHQGEITFSIMYAFTEHFMLPLSHDEVVHGKGALIRKMPGDDWQKFANLRAMYAYMYAHPGTKLLFMGAEMAQSTEWNHDSSLDWHLLQHRPHEGVQQEVRVLNQIYKQEPALYAHSFDQEGFEWLDYNDAHNSIISFLRKGNTPDETIMVVCNFTPAVYDHYRLGVPMAGQWEEIFNSDEQRFGGSNYRGNLEPLFSVPEPYHGRPFSLELKLSPLSVIYFKLRK